MPYSYRYPNVRIVWPSTEVPDPSDYEDLVTDPAECDHEGENPCSRCCGCEDCVYLRHEDFNDNAREDELCDREDGIDDDF